MAIKNHIPNSLTCANLLCGCIGIKFAYEGNLLWSVYLIGAALVFDFFDGFVARLLKVSSPIGKDLDSLADMVTFGVLPGVIMYQLIFKADCFHPGWHTVINNKPLLPYIAFMIPVFSALRLAKFNNDPRQTDSFIGVPTPAVTMFIASIPLMISDPLVRPPQQGWTFYPPLSGVLDTLSVFSDTQTGLPIPLGHAPNFTDQIFSNIYVLIAITIVVSFLLVSELPLFALKFKNFSWADNKIRFVFLICCVVLMIIFKFAAIPLIIILY
ncbi:MAG: CDP-alcohol phosphatidyltransferase family protein, partial [Bacteroidia bacterium]